MIHTTIATTKAVSTGAISVALLSFFDDTEIVFLIITGLFASISSYFYDWVHKHPREFRLRELSELIKYCFYGLSVLFVVYYLGKNNASQYVDLPSSAWGFVAALCAGSAIKIVEFSGGIFSKFITTKAGK